MRRTLIFSAALAFLLSNPLAAADDPWSTYVSREDRFALNLPGQPNIESFIYVSEYGSPWQARRHTLHFEGYLHRMSVVDMSTGQSDSVSPGFEKRGAMAFAASNLRESGEVILDNYDQVQIIPGHKLEILLPDGRLNLVDLRIHDELLYIQESISPVDAIPAYYVPSSMELLNADLIVPRYQNASFPGPIPIASMSAYSPRAQAQGGTDFVSREDHFAVMFPGEPMVDEFIYESAQYSPWNARRYSTGQDGHRYTMTVIDMSTTRLVAGVDAVRNTARPSWERSDAPVFAASNLRKSGDVLVDRYVERQAIPGHRLQLILENGRRKSAEIYTHYDLLYILEHVSPVGAANDAASGFDIHASLQLLDGDGNIPLYIDDNRSYPDFITMTGDGTAASGRDLGALISEGEAAP